MLESATAAHFFLSSNSPQGYLSCFDNLYDAKDGWKAYILLGGIDSVKSRMLEKIGHTMESAGKKTEYIHSCFDASEVSAVSFPDLRVCVIDGAPPNQCVWDYPGVAESVVNFGDFICEEKLSAHRDNIILFSARINASSERAYRFLSAAASLLSDSCRLALECTDLSKLESYASHIARHEFPLQSRQGRESMRFISAVTPDGVKNLFGSVTSAYKHICEIDDDFGVGKLFLNKLRCYALSSGYDVISCFCPMSPVGRPEHLLIPSLSLAFVTTGHNHPFGGEGNRHIHIRRFIDKEALKLKRPRISFNRKASHELIDQAVLLLGDAKASRDMIKSYYLEATDLEAAAGKAEELTNKLFSL